VIERWNNHFACTKLLAKIPMMNAWCRVSLLGLLALAVLVLPMDGQQQQLAPKASDTSYPMVDKRETKDHPATTTGPQYPPTSYLRSDFSRRYLDYGDEEVSYDDGESLSDHPRQLQLVSGGRPFEKLRIKFDTRVIKTFLGQSDALDGKINTIVNETLPAAAAQWARHLSIRSVRSPFVVGPRECQLEYASFLKDDVYYTDTDLVVIVAGDRGGLYCNGRVLAYARACDLDQLDRPIVGVITFCLDRETTADGYLIGKLPNLNGVDLATFYEAWTGATFRAQHLRLSLLEITVHELAHILGLSSNLYPYFRDENGVPRTNRTDAGVAVVSEHTCSNGTSVLDIQASAETIQAVQRNGRWEQYMITPRIQSVARNHFNCPELPGARLQEDDNCVGSHWHERHTFGELLGPAVTEGSASILTVFTLAFMEDTGWYQVDYRGGGHPVFGMGAGCDFVFDECIDRSTSQLPDFVVDEFCTAPLIFEQSTLTRESLNSVFCDPSHQSWVLCDLSTFRAVAASETTYFSDPDLATIFFSRADNCPIPILTLGLDCRIDDPYNVFYPGESVGNSSRCLNAYYDSDGARAYQPACLKVVCDVDAGVVRIGEDGSQQNCTFDGEELPVKGRDGAFFLCPRLAVLCPEIFACPDGCSGRGDCIYSEGNTAPPVCRCFDEQNTDKACAPDYITGLSSTLAPNAAATTTRPSASPIGVASTRPSMQPTAISSAGITSEPKTSPRGPPSSAPSNSTNGTTNSSRPFAGNATIDATDLSPASVLSPQSSMPAIPQTAIQSRPVAPVEPPGPASAPARSAGAYHMVAIASASLLPWITAILWMIL
jgi:hypothetical protein